MECHRHFTPEGSEGLKVMLNSVRILIGFGVCASLFQGGCTLQEPELTLQEQETLEQRYTGASVSMRGRPADLDAAVRYVVSRVGDGMAVVEITTPEPWEREYELVSATDEPGWVLIRTPDDSPLGTWERVESARFIVHAKLGRFGDPVAEQQLLRMLDRRLAEMASGR